MPKKQLTKEQEINLLWLEIKKNNNELSEATYKAVKRCIEKNQPIKHIKSASAIEREYLRIFAMPQNAEFITECFIVQGKLQGILQGMLNDGKS